ncbi:DnaJ subfamily C member 27 [Tetrabaena socialis]|uniref:DnaJ subfamily C member 27 n=1 Tax=Tetrabaena socialis TaxID=47790 RepID=A0A2J7ZQC7_9CHLO|nr:DnaJ subfamily C member 27 [Tetrabaena socialis]|eukprot:PNH02474.1 DnaJ subfamily C member 27 [Tetrabaena socialis]
MLLLSSRRAGVSNLGLRQTRRPGGCLAARRVLEPAPSHQLLHSQQQQLLPSPRACAAASAASGDPPAKPAAELSTDGGAGRPAEPTTKRSGRAVELMAAALRTALSNPTVLAALRSDPDGEVALLRSELARQAERVRQLEAQVAAVQQAAAEAQTCLLDVVRAELAMRVRSLEERVGHLDWCIIDPSEEMEAACDRLEDRAEEAAAAAAGEEEEAEEEAEGEGEEAIEGEETEEEADTPEGEAVAGEESKEELDVVEGVVAAGEEADEPEQQAQALCAELEAAEAAQQVPPALEAAPPERDARAPTVAAAKANAADRDGGGGGGDGDGPDAGVGVTAGSGSVADGSAAGGGGACRPGAEEGGAVGHLGAPAGVRAAEAGGGGGPAGGGGGGSGDGGGGGGGDGGGGKDDGNTGGGGKDDGSSGAGAFDWLRGWGPAQVLVTLWAAVAGVRYILQVTPQGSRGTGSATGCARWDAGDVVTPENCRVGLKVVRGPDWSERVNGNEDGGAGRACVLSYERPCGEQQQLPQAGARHAANNGSSTAYPRLALASQLQPLQSELLDALRRERQQQPAASGSGGKPEHWPETLQQANIHLTRLAAEGEALREQLAARGREAEQRQEELRDAQAQLSFLHDECEALRSWRAEAQRQHNRTVFALRQREAELEAARDCAAAAHTASRTELAAARDSAAAAQAMGRAELAAVKDFAAAAEAAGRAELEVVRGSAAAAAAFLRAELKTAVAQSETLRGTLAGALSVLRVAREREEAGRAERVAAATGAAEARRALRQLLKEQDSNAKMEAAALRARIAALEAAEAAWKEAKRKEDAQRVQQVFRSAGTPYKMLKLQLDCSAEEVKEAYRSLALQLHPDKCGAEGAGEAFGLATAARDSLLELCAASQRAKSIARGAGAYAHGAGASA